MSAFVKWHQQCSALVKWERNTLCLILCIPHIPSHSLSLQVLLSRPYVQCCAVIVAIFVNAWTKSVLVFMVFCYQPWIIYVLPPPPKLPPVDIVFNSPNWSQVYKRVCEQHCSQSNCVLKLTIWVTSPMHTVMISHIVLVAHQQTHLTRVGVHALEYLSVRVCIQRYCLSISFCYRRSLSLSRVPA